MSTKKALFSPIGIVENLVFSEKTVQAIYKLSGDDFSFKRGEDMIGLVQAISNNLATLLPNKVSPLNCQWIITYRPLDAAKWEEDFQKVIDGWYPLDDEEKANKYLELQNTLANMRSYMYQNDFVKQEVYLGIDLGRRGQAERPEGFDLKEFLTYTKQIIDATVKQRDPQITQSEVDYWKRKEERYRTGVTQGVLKGIPAKASEVAYLIKQPMWPLMPMPEFLDEDKKVWGRGEVQSLGSSWIEKRPKCLKITQQRWDGEDMVRYRAALCFSKFPDAMIFPTTMPWIQTSSLLGVGVTFNARFSIVPAEKVRKDLNRKLQETKDEAINAQNAGEMPQDIIERMTMAEALEYEITRNGGDWIYGSYRLHIEAGSEEELRKRVSAAISHYKDLGIELAWPSGGDQFKLLQESIPSDEKRVKSYEQRQILTTFAGGLPTALTSIGDRIEGGSQKKAGEGWIGPFLGKTVSNFSEAVFMSIHSAIARNNPPGIVITGSSGSGKSFLAFKIAVDMALQDIWTIYIDPKADATPITEINGLGDANVFDLKDGNSGLLDPFSLGSSRAECTLMAIETLKLLLGQRLTGGQEVQLSEAINYVTEREEPSLNKVVDFLLANDNDDAKGLGYRLRLIRELDFARLCFSPRKAVNLSPERGLTVITLLGLGLPTESITTDDYTESNRLAVAIMYLLSTFTLQLMITLNKSHPKAVVIDEAWAITNTRAGKELIPLVARMGRSHNTALVMISQNAGDFLKEGWLNSVSLKFSFRAKKGDEITEVIKLHDLEETDYLRDTIKHLRRGEALFQDVDGRTSVIEVIEIDPVKKEKFNTNPHTRGKAVLSD